MAFIHPEISGMAHARSMQFQGHLQPHVPARSLSHTDRKAIGTTYFQEPPVAPLSPGMHFHKRADFGGKPPQNFLSNSAYYATLSQRYCLRSSLTCTERHGRGVEMLREANSGRRPERARGKLTPDLHHLHPKSLLPSRWGGRTKSMTPAPGCLNPEIVAGANPAHAGDMMWRKPGLHQGWTTAFDAEGGCIEFKDEGAVRDTKQIGQETRFLIQDMKMKIQMQRSAEQNMQRERIRQEKQHLAEEMRQLDARLQEERNERLKAALAEQQFKKDARAKAIRCKQEADAKTQQRKDADKLYNMKKKAEADKVLQERREAISKARETKRVGKQNAEEKRKQTVQELRTQSLMAKRGSIDYLDSLKLSHDEAGDDAGLVASES